MTMLTGAGAVIRLIGILRILKRRDALWFLEGRHVPRRLRLIGLLTAGSRKKTTARRGERLAQALSELGPAFVKLGQALSMRADLIGLDVAEDLARLQDNMPPFPTKIARATIERELGGPLGNFFREFSDRPTAAASIAQVHRAVTTEGAQVAVKILRPDVEQRFAEDLEMFSWLAALAERWIPKARRLRPSEVLDVVRKWVATETNLLLEAAAAAELAENHAGEQGIRVPAVDWDRTARRVLTLEWVEGRRIDDLQGLRQDGHDPDDLLRECARLLFLQVFRDGFFHADLHPGNLFVDKNGVILPIDFGIMGHTERRVRIFITEILTGFLTGDYGRVADAHFDLGLVPPHHSRDDFRLALRAIGEPLIDKPINEISIARLLLQMFRTTEDFDMRTQPDMLLLQKTLLSAEGIGRMLNPNVNMWMLIRPVIEDWLIAEQGPEAKALRAARRTADLLLRAPEILEKAERALEAVATLGGTLGGSRETPPPPPRRRGLGTAGRLCLDLLLGISAAALLVLLF